MKERQFSRNRNEMSPDENCEQLLDSILKTDNLTSLPGDFADRVTLKAIQRMELKQSLSEFLIYTGVVSGILVFFLSFMYTFSNENVKKWVDAFSPNIFLILGIAVTLLFILFLDRVILPQFFLRRRENNFS